MGILDKLRERREQTKTGAAERARDKDETRQIAENARREGRLEGVQKGARERGLMEGERIGRGEAGLGGFVKGALSPRPQTVTTRTVRGKGKNRRVTTMTRQVKKGGVAAGLKGLGFDKIGGPSAEGFSLGGGPSEGIGFGSSSSSRKRRRDDSDWERAIAG